MHINCARSVKWEKQKDDIMSVTPTPDLAAVR